MPPDLNKTEIQNKVKICEVLPVAFNSLTSEQLKTIKANRFVVKFKAGETIFKQGGALTHIIYIIEGKVKVLLEGSNGETILLEIQKKPDMIGGPGFNTDWRNHFSVVALEDTTTCFIEVNLFKRLVLSNQPFAINLISHLNQRIMQLYDKLRSLTHKHMNGRLADTLIYLSNFYQSPEFSSLLSRSDIANMSSMTNESAIRTLKKFKDDGIIDYKGDYFKILKKDVLMDISKKG